MMMGKRTWVLLIAVLSAFGMGCGDDGGGDGSPVNNAGSGAGSGTAGSGTAGSGTAGSGEAGSGGGGSNIMLDPTKIAEDDMCVNYGDYNEECPPVEPLTGACNQRGECCHRSSNLVKESRLGPNDPLVLEYRVNFSNTINHPMTIGVEFIANSTTIRYQNEQQSTLWRFVLPRENGQLIEGAGMATLGVGRYNCDGTYSYYSATAAPVRDGVSDDQARWQAREVVTMVDPSQSGRDMIKTTFENTSNRELTYTAFLNNEGTELDWELIHQGFDFVEIDLSDESRDCIGSVAPGPVWQAGGEFVIYTPMELNDEQVITLTSTTYCQLVAFGLLPEGERGMRCTTTERCLPGTADCPWLKLPDSLCPVTDAEKDLFGCHLGDPDNVNMEEGYPETVDCTMEAPTSPADPELGSPGQCCDPLGDQDPDNTLPACNAYRLRQDFVAAAAEITDEPEGAIQPDCIP